MKDQTEVKIAGGALAIYGILILGNIGRLVANEGLSQPLTMIAAIIIGLTFVVGGFGSFNMKKWGLYITGASILGILLLSVITNVIIGGTLPVILMLAILWDISKHREKMD